MLPHICSAVVREITPVGDAPGKIYSARFALAKFQNLGIVNNLYIFVVCHPIICRMHHEQSTIRNTYSNKTITGNRGSNGYKL